MLPALYTLSIYDFDLRATYARTLLPAALASVSFGFVLVRVRVRLSRWSLSAHYVSRPRYTRHFLGYFFAPAGHRFNVFLRRRAPADLRIAYRLSSFFFLANVV